MLGKTHFNESTYYYKILASTLDKPAVKYYVQETIGLKLNVGLCTLGIKYNRAGELQSKYDKIYLVEY